MRDKKTKPWCRTALLACLAVWPLAWAGCGGGLTQEDMMRHAIRRPSDDDEKAVVATAKKKPELQEKQDQPDTAAADPPAPKLERGAGRSGPGADRSATATPAQSAAASHATAPRDSAAATGPDATADANASGETAATAAPSGPPPQPLTLTQRRQRTIDNLTRIGAAIRQYCETNGKLFGPAILNTKGQPMLSWRVELLPYLGYQELYDKFDSSEPWDSPRNLPLLELTPDVYQSPERLDNKTNYLVPIATYSAFSRPRGIGVRNLEDGLENTVVLLEVDDALAVPWTQPEDLKVQIPALVRREAPLRSDGTFVLWGDGSLSCAAPEGSAKDWRAVFTIDGGDAFASHAMRAPVEATVANLLAEDAAAPATTAATAGPSTATATGDDARSRSHMELARDGGGRTAPATSATTTPSRQAVPPPQDLERARRLVREIYGERYEQSRSGRDQQALAREMLRQIPSMNDDPAGQYVTLDIVLQIAVQAGDSNTAIAAMEDIMARFDVDPLKYRYQILQQLTKWRDRSAAVNQSLLEQAEKLVEEAVQVEDFDMAEGLCQIALGAARQLRDTEQENDLERKMRSVQQARRAHQLLHRTIANLQDADDPQANLHGGRYYCLVRGEWEKGLPLLAKCGNAQLKSLAETELLLPTDPARQVELADGWWELSSTESDHAKQLRVHAGTWYQRALEGLPQGLLRVKAELRLKQIQQDYGTDVLASGG